MIKKQYPLTNRIATGQTTKFSVYNLTVPAESRFYDLVRGTKVIDYSFLRNLHTQQNDHKSIW